MLAVLVMTDASAQLSEKATFCKLNDEKRPSVVGLPDVTTQQVCPADLSKGADEVTTAYPDGWYVRIMFDELLDPSIETLTEIIDSDGNPTGNFEGSIAASHPVQLECGSINGGTVGVDYDGYYQPAGNRVTWPVGPSLVIKPNNPKAIATNTECTLTINTSVVRDKSGTPVPDNEKGPFKFKIAPIQVIAIDPPDDPESANPIPALQLYFDNPYIQFNTYVDLASLCPGSGGADFSGCNDEAVFSITDVAHAAEGPGVCDQTGNPCSTVADCDATMSDTICGRGLCAADGSVCNKASDCPTAMDNCQTNLAYRYSILGATETEFGISPMNPVETEHKYTMQFTAGAKLKDRCGHETTLGAPSADDLTLVHFATLAFDYVKSSIVSGETATANKRLQFNWNNVVESPTDVDVAGGQFTISPMPQKLVVPTCTSTAECPAGATCNTATSQCVGTTTCAVPADCPAPTTCNTTALKCTAFFVCKPGGAGCATADLTAAQVLVAASDGSGQIMLNGHLKLNTEYTATLKAGVVVKDFYGKQWTNAADKVITWKTQPAIQMTGLSVRNFGEFVSVGDKGTIVKPTPDNPIDIRLAFNASMDPTTLDVADVKVESVSGGPVPTLALASSSGCGATSNTTNSLGTCTLRLRGLYQPGTYKITLVAGAQFKDIFGVDYSQAADKSITVTVEEAPLPIQCL